jgi:hypothetical protein
MPIGGTDKGWALGGEQDNIHEDAKKRDYSWCSEMMKAFCLEIKGIESQIWLRGQPLLWFNPLFPFGILVSFLGLYRPANSSSPLVKVFTVFVTHLAARLATTVLATLLETRVQVGTNDTLVEFGAANVFQTVKSILVCVVLNEAEPTGCLVEAIETHDEALDFAALCEKLVNLFFGCVERPFDDTKKVRFWLLFLNLDLGRQTGCQHREL